MTREFAPGTWALILGGSSGIGLASARALAERGMNLCLVHRDLRVQLPEIEAEFEKLRGLGIQLLTCNTDALSPEKRAAVLDELTSAMRGEGRVRVLLHSIAAGRLKPLAPSEDAPRTLTESDFAKTIHAMGTSLLGWVREIFDRGLFAEDSRVFGLTSEGNSLAWQGYGAVSAAKVTLEALARQIAVEFAPHGIRCNVLQPGITETPALAAIPGADVLRSRARARNPLGRLTTPRDVANVICLLASDEAAWINGAVIPVDGGERISGIGNE